MRSMPCQGPRMPPYPYQQQWAHPDPFGGRLPHQPMFMGQQPPWLHRPPGPYHNPRYQNLNRYHAPSQRSHRHRNANRGPNNRINNQGDDNNGVNQNDNNRDICFVCGDLLENSQERSVHLCGGILKSLKEGSNGNADNPETMTEEELDAKLESVLLKIKDCLNNKYQSVTQTLEEYVTERIDEIHTIHREVGEERAILETMKRELEKRSCLLEKKEKELKERQSRLRRDRDYYNTKHRKEKVEICRQWQQLKDEISRMEEMHELQKGRVRLDVGGNVYTTSRLTLTRDSESMLAAMFSGRHEVVTEKDGTVFIDRDGTHFRYILNYLRDGGLSVDALPRNRQILRELRNEAVFYQLHSLIQQIEKLL
ncbi:hypothetical protein ScPMuIL_012506 [Solemya velum]